MYWAKHRARLELLMSLPSTLHVGSAIVSGRPGSLGVLGDRVRAHPARRLARDLLRLEAVDHGVVAVDAHRDGADAERDQNHAGCDTSVFEPFPLAHGAPPPDRSGAAGVSTSGGSITVDALPSSQRGRGASGDCPRPSAETPRDSRGQLRRPLVGSLHDAARARCDPAGARVGHRPRAPQARHRARHGARRRDPRRRPRRGDDRAHRGRLSHALFVRGSGAALRRRGRGCHFRPAPLRRDEPRREGGPDVAAARRPAREDDLARSGHARARDRVGQGRRRQVDADGESRGRARRARRAGRRPRRGRLRPLDPAHARRQPAAGRRRHDDRAAGAGRPEADVDRVLPRRQRAGDVARPDAPPRARAVPLRRLLGRARHARRRHAAGHG